MADWTAQDKARVAEMYHAGATDREIADALSRTVAAVEKMRSGMKLMRQSGTKTKLVPEGFAEVAARPSHELEKLYKVGPKIITRWRKDVGVKIAPADLIRKPMPASFEEDYPNYSLSQLQQMYGASRDTLIKWRKALGLPSKDAVNWAGARPKTPLPDDWMDKAQNMTSSQAAAYWGLHRAVIARLHKEAGTKPANKREFVTGGVVKDTRTKQVLPQRSGPKALSPNIQSEVLGEVANAAHYLRRFFRNVHSAAIVLYGSETDSYRQRVTWGKARKIPNNGEGYYYVEGCGVVTDQQIVDMAQERGWRRM